MEKLELKGSFIRETSRVHCGNRFQKAFLLGPESTKALVNGSIPSLCHLKCGIDPARWVVCAAHFHRIGPAWRSLVGCGRGNWAKRIGRLQALNQIPRGH